MDVEIAIEIPTYKLYVIVKIYSQTCVPSQLSKIHLHKLTILRNWRPLAAWVQY